MDAGGVEPRHEPVLLKEVINYLITDRSGLYIDGTAGLGGHTTALLDSLDTEGRVVAVELDPATHDLLRVRVEKFGARVTVRHGSYNQLPRILLELGLDQCQGVLLDLGISSFSLEGTGRGFSFTRDEPLDMRFNPEQGHPLSMALKSMSVEGITKIIKDYGEERRAFPIATRMVEAIQANALETSQQLADIVRSVVKGPGTPKSLARVFQALRIFINAELKVLESALNNLASILAPGSRIAVISFHSLEDRLVKHFFNHESKDCICPSDLPVCICEHRAAYRIITRKPILPTPDEQSFNSRARSAKLRVAERV
jgi:16S rRNA (cytosine1402-N4)-methyltransferase